MKNFYDLPDTDQIKINLDLCVEPMFAEAGPHCQIIINNVCLFDDRLMNEKTFETELGLLDSLTLSITLKNKNYKTSPSTAILVKSLKLDNFNLIPMWLKDVTYDNDHHYDKITTHLGFNGTWKLKIPEPFYLWKHKITGQGWLLHP